MTHMEQRGLNHFSQLLDLLFTTSDITVGHIRLLLHLLCTVHNYSCNFALINVYDPKQTNQFHTCIIVTVGSILGGSGI